jgi:2-polyprenyl-6-methoxyphenol hydroxylase-like FAD-dependent oxidoreductase
LASGRIAVLGDAAHPMTPDLGQGACQGIEDAVVIAACLAQIDDPTLALADYQSTRLARVRSIVRGSRRIGVLATSKSPIACAVRNAALRHVPTSINSRMVARYASERAFDRTLPPHSHV